MIDETSQCGTCKTINGCTCPPPKPKARKCRKCGGTGMRRVDIGSSLDRHIRCDCRPDNRFYREAHPISPANRIPSGVPIKPLSEYRDEFNTTRDAEEGYAASVRLATVLMQKHFPEATGWKPALDLCGVISQIDNMTAGLARVDRIVDVANKVSADLAQEAQQWTMDRMPAAAMDAAAKSAGADILRRRIEQTAHYDPGFAKIDQ